MRARIGGFVFVVVVAFMATACSGGGVARHYGLPQKHSQPAGITTGPDGNLWFTQFSGGRIARISTAGQLVEYPIPTNRAGPFDITTGPDGNLWFTEFSANKIGRVSPAGEFKEFPLPNEKSGPYGITVGPDGNLWFALQKTDRIARMTIDGDIKEFPIPYTGPQRPSPRRYAPGTRPLRARVGDGELLDVAVDRQDRKSVV